MKDLGATARNLRLAPDGVWYADGHRDLGFLNEDETDWAQLEPRSFWYRHRNGVFTRIFRRFPPQGTLYEIGAGNGTVALCLQSMGIDVIALEPTLRFARAAKARGVETVACTSLEAAGFAAASLPNVGLFDVLEHIDAQGAFLRYVSGLMLPGGRLYCAVPAYPWLWSAEDAVAGHRRRYTTSSLRAVLEDSGFRVEYSTYFFAALTVPILVLRALPTWLGFRSRRTKEVSETEHDLGRGALSAVVEAVLRPELRVLAAGRRVPFGSSCLAIATRA